MTVLNKTHQVNVEEAFAALSGESTTSTAEQTPTATTRNQSRDGRTITQLQRRMTELTNKILNHGI